MQGSAYITFCLLSAKLSSLHQGFNMLTLWYNTRLYSKLPTQVVQGGFWGGTSIYRYIYVFIYTRSIHIKAFQLLLLNCQKAQCSPHFVALGGLLHVAGQSHSCPRARALACFGLSRRFQDGQSDGALRRLSDGAFHAGFATHWSFF